MMVRLETVSENTFFPVVRLKVSPEQEKFVASNVMSLAQAWLHYDIAKPFAILDDDMVVGFLMLDYDEWERTAGIWRMMIGHDFQKRGYGRAALSEALNMLRESGKFDLVHLSFVTGNTAARDLYYALGFRETGEMDDDEIIMTLPLTDQPKVGITVADGDDLQELWELVLAMKEQGTAVPSTMETEDALKAAVETHQVRRLTLMGDAVGIYIDGELLLSKDFASYRDEAMERIEQFEKVR